MEMSPRCQGFICRFILGLSTLIGGAVDLRTSYGDPGAIPASAVPGKPADSTVEDATLLGERFESRSAGIAFSAPADCRKVVRVGSSEIVAYVNEERHWTLTVAKSSLGQPMDIDSKPATGPKNPAQPGLLELTIDQLKTTMPGATVLRQDKINIGANDCGLVVIRYSIGAQRSLQQQAFLQLDPQLYYVFKFITPGGSSRVKEGEQDNSPPDPIEKQAVETFNALLDSVKLLDRSEIKADQVNRLYRTRAQFLNWTPDKFRQTIDPQFKGKNDDAIQRKQYFMIQHDHEPVGYLYEFDQIENRDNKDGVNVYIRTHTEPEKGKVYDTARNMWMAFDRRSEKWVYTSIVHDLAPKPNSEAETHATEVGDMIWETKMAYDPRNGVESAEEAERDKKVGMRKGVPLMRPVELHTLDVSLIGKHENGKPIHRDLPPFYLPQAPGYLLARLLVDSRPSEKRTYMFYSFASENDEVVARYVDVELPRQMPWKEKPVEVVAISDRITLDGSPTVHYLTLDGTLLYSENKDAKLLIMPATLEQVQARWKDADFEKPALESK